jgi:hypothetical protein
MRNCYGFHDNNSLVKCQSDLHDKEKNDGNTSPQNENILKGQKMDKITNFQLFTTELKQRLKTWGADLVGIADAEPHDHSHE